MPGPAGRSGLSDPGLSLYGRRCPGTGRGCPAQSRSTAAGPAVYPAQRQGPGRGRIGLAPVPSHQGTKAWSFFRALRGGVVLVA